MLDFIWTLPVHLPGTLNKWRIQNFLFIVRFEPLHGNETSLQVHRLNRSGNSRLLWMQKLNLHLMPVSMYIYAIYIKKTWTCACTCTVNVVIFAGGKFRENIGKTFHVGVIITILLLFSFIKEYGFYFRVGVLFTKQTKARKTRKLPNAKLSVFTVFQTNNVLVVVHFSDIKYWYC